MLSKQRADNHDACPMFSPVYLVAPSMFSALVVNASEAASPTAVQCDPHLYFQQSFWRGALQADRILFALFTLFTMCC